MTQSKSSNLLFYIFICGYFCISLGLNNGFILGGLTAFDPGFLERLDITVAQLKLRDSMTFIIIGVFALATGALVDKLGTIKVLVIGHILFSLAFWMLSRAGSIEEIYGAQIVLGFCQLCCGYLVCVIALSRYLPYNVGLAIGLMMASTSLGSAFLPTVNGALIEQFGASTALAIIAASSLPLALGAILIGICKPRGKTVDAKTETLLPGPTLKEALRRYDFWAIVVIAVFSFSSFVGLVTNLAIFADSPPFNDISVSETFFVALFITSLMAQVISGWVADKMPLRGLHMAGLLAMATSTLGLALSTQASTAAPWFALTGLGWGFNYVFVQVAVPARFSGQSLGKIFGAILIAESFAGAAGAYMFGAAFDIFGSYTPMLLIATALLTLSAIAAFVLHKPKEQKAHAFA